MARHWFLWAALLLCTAVGASAGPVLPGPYVAEVVRVKDGDTFVAKITIMTWLNITTVVEATVRPRGYDTPETHRPQCPEERALGQHATEIFAGVLQHAPVILHNVASDTSAGDRVLADVTVAEGLSLANIMIQSGYARAYSKGPRPGWCE